MKRRGFIGSLIAAATAPFVAKKKSTIHAEKWVIDLDRWKRSGGNGISTRMISQYDASRDVMVTRFDVLYDIALDTSNPAHFTRIEG